ncbi:hypothetical protein GMA11_00740 [Granulicatella sp. zg-ZJ]|uniref:hypothetical protein n=1 Tax=unclassified Granulicatella TaxID=2630493 RepID=UPI0013BEDD39|nr:MULTISPECIES: hypothetical protein [unclassified Granulicatella]MBS4749817.1 hypothetical protein [Carnobacteriaceae bacterium zg-ZUI78]NEW61909.1 hypothetical protein [Granulicatella sp. zg-ZJ]NEW66243.1 hypothetical protein [Granulicatella sp. zg-84]QMI85917.1 hypothetical protein H1220_00655 [Carnobacteriaceae bacterium zg-84]
MDLPMITLLKYEYEVSPGAFFNVYTPWITDPTQMKTIIIDQDHYFTKMVTIYPSETHDFFMYLEQEPTRSVYRTNYPLKRMENSDSYEIIFEG